MTYTKKNAKIYSMKKALNIVVTSPINGISRIKLNEPSTMLYLQKHLNP